MYFIFKHFIIGVNLVKFRKHTSYKNYATFFDRRNDGT